MTASAIIFELHGSLLRMMSLSSGVHYQGIAQAARQLRARGKLCRRTTKKLIELDYAYNITRHITEISAQAFVKKVSSQLSVSSAMDHDVPTDGVVGLCVDVQTDVVTEVPVIEPVAFQILGELNSPRGDVA